MAAQHPDVAAPTLESFKDILGSEEWKQQLETNFQGLQSENFSIDQLSAMLVEWGVRHESNSRHACFIEGQEPRVITHDNDQNARNVWIYNDGVSLLEDQGKGHYDGMKQPGTADPMTTELVAYLPNETVIGPEDTASSISDKSDKSGASHHTNDSADPASPSWMKKKAPPPPPVVGTADAWSSVAPVPSTADPERHFGTVYARPAHLVVMGPDSMTPL